MPLTQQDLADALSLSTTTISRSLRSDPTISPQTRARVVEYAEKRGYRLPASRRFASGGEANQGVTALSVLIHNDGIERGEHSSPALQILAGMSDAARSGDIALTVHMVDTPRLQSWTRGDDLPADLKPDRVQGLLLVRHFPDAIAERLAERYRCVLVSQSHANVEADSIDADMPLATQRLVEHLHRLGHRRIAFVGQQPVWRHLRYSGFVRGLAVCGIDAAQALTINVFQPLDGVGRVVDEMLRHLRDGCTAFVSAGSGEDILRELRYRGIELPRDLSFASIDAPRHHEAGLDVTTVRTAFKAIGIASLRILQQRIAAPDEPTRHVLVRGEFHEGQTTGAVPDVVGTT
jgi:LacI family transcriptional regulator